VIKALKQIGENLGVREGFKSEYWAPDEEDVVAIVNLNTNQPLSVKEKFEYRPEEYENSSKDYLLYYASGNDSLVGGTLGIGGVSPFFLDPTKIEEDKIDKSGGFVEYYEKSYSDGLVEKLLEDLKGREDEFASLEADWVYISSFGETNTEDRHRHFIDEYLKAPQNKKINWVEGNCGLCGKEGKLRDIRLPFYSLDISNYNFNMASNKVDKGRLKLCRDCELEVTAGWKHLNNLFGNNYVLIPELRYDSSDTQNLVEFFKIAREAESDFERLNNLIESRSLYEDLEFTFLVTSRQQSKLNIHKSVPNYKLFAQRFENEYLVEDDSLKYFPAEGVDLDVSIVDNYFDLERLLKQYFVDDNNYKLENIYGRSFHFYHLYNTDLPQNLTSPFKHLLYTHRDELFTFIYDVNPEALNTRTLNEIVENFLRYELRKEDTGSGFGGGLVRNKIIEGLNAYYFFRNKILGDINMRSKTDELKDYFKGFNQEDRGKIKDMVQTEPELLYFLMGQFIGKIDAFRYNENKNQIFGNFIESLNQRSAKKRLAEDIIQNQNYYIQRLNKKAKYVFDLLSDNLGELFENEDFSKIVIALNTGYYSTENILTTEKEADEE